MVTIIIPTYNRPDRLKRLLGYFSDSGIHGKIIIADSSTSENKKRNKAIVSSYSGMDILYLDHFAPDTIGWVKWGEAIGRSNSKYTVICADDDFIVPKCIDEAVSFLEKNSDFVLADGAYVSFEAGKGAEEKSRFLWRPIYPHKTIDFSDPATRVAFHFANYYPTLFSVHRTYILEMIFKQTVKYSMENGYMGELFCSILSLIYGKSKSLNSLYSAKESISDSYSKVHEDVDDLVDRGSYGALYKKFKQGLVINLCKEARISEEEAGKVIDAGMNIYLKKYYFNSGVRIKKILRETKLPFGLNQVLRSIYVKMLKHKQPKGYSDDLANSENFKKIHEAIMTYLDDK
ncbi:MAG: TIGR00180 family glycosyltransferase [Candidatus Paceibacterota bacterium]|jgi:glycosyltransferase domain-containing protein